MQPPIHAPHHDAISWEDLIGRKALGWVAVVVLLFATAFFLRYAFENAWIGPLGRVTLGIVAGLALVRQGRRSIASVGGCSRKCSRRPALCYCIYRSMEPLAFTI